MTTDVEIELLPRKRGEPPVIRGNWYATILLNDLFDYGFRGFNFGPGIISQLRGALHGYIGRGGLSRSEISWTKRELHRVLHVFNKVRYYPGYVIYIGAQDAEGSGAEAVTRHELMHSAQRRLGANGDDIGHAGDPQAFLSHPLAAKAAAALVGELNYVDEPHTLMSEIGAHLAEGIGGAETLGLTKEEGRQLFKIYWAAIHSRNGNKIYHEPLLLPLIEQWSLSNESNFGTDGEAQPRESRGPAQRKGAAGKPATAGSRSQIASRHRLAANDCEGSGSLADASADMGRQRPGSSSRRVGEHRQERSAAPGGAPR
jgi:hypothetical protein